MAITSHMPALSLVGCDTDDMTDEDLTEADWDALGFHDATELGGGWQSRVFRANGPEGTMAVKLTPVTLADRALLDRRSAVVAKLADRNARVAKPVHVIGSLVHSFGGWLVTATRFVEGPHPDHFKGPHGEQMGSTLADLHQSMADLPNVELPRVAALQADVSSQWRSGESDQLLHGDFAASNLVNATDGIHILDFDDCGYGPPDFDVANSLYMVLFDCWVEDRLEDYQRFKRAFVGAYETSAHRSVDQATVESLMNVRVMALKRWLTDPSGAPIGIRNSPPEWISTLNRFVKDWSDGRAVLP